MALIDAKEAVEWQEAAERMNDEREQLAQKVVRQDDLLKRAAEQALALAKEVERWAKTARDKHELVQRAAELLREVSVMGQTPQGWYAKRDQWWRDAGIK
jgi:uncharacterized glyoxalase superfamily metalloenzyme YdcJ